MSPQEPTLTKRCAVCGRFRAYREDDVFCIGCGNDTLEAECSCGRSYDYALAEEQVANIHCPKCGRTLRGRAAEFDG